MLPIYEVLFNIIFDQGVIPTPWLEGIIRPIFKKSGDISNPENYRPISILSCFGKLFTAVLNARLTKFIDSNNILEENQAGFRKGYSTSDHVFALHALIELLKTRKKNLFCCFVDFTKAFDSVWRVGLWQKLLKSSVDGKMFRIVRNMYSSIKSCVRIGTTETPFFTSGCGVRQGENLSPLLFSLFLNDLENFLFMNRCDGIGIQYSDDDIFLYFELLILLYADDAVLVSDNAETLQQNINYFLLYCKEWRLNINLRKTKIMIFGLRKTNRYRFYLDKAEIEIVDSFKYLGVTFSKTRSFCAARKHVLGQARKALQLLYKKIRNFNLPIDLQLKMFDHTVLPILLYGSEIWGFENIDQLETFHNDFLRKISNMRKSTPIYILHGELGRFPISINIKMRMLGFWTSMIT